MLLPLLVQEGLSPGALQAYMTSSVSPLPFSSEAPIYVISNTCKVDGQLPRASKEASDYSTGQSVEGHCAEGNGKCSHRATSHNSPGASKENDFVPHSAAALPASRTWTFPLGLNLPPRKRN